MDTIFGASWSDLTPDLLEAFLSTAGGEPLSWEAKADDEKGGLKAADVARAVCAFANSEHGGYLIVGAKQERKQGPWSLPGLRRPPAADLTTWVGQIARSIAPAPMVDVRDFPQSDSRGPSAVAWVPAIDEPPAMTADGGIYIRVAGASPAVTDPRILAQLYERGQAARTLAEHSTERALASLAPGPETFGTFGFAATGGPRGYASTLFTHAAVEAIEVAAVGAMRNGRILRPSNPAITQDTVRVTVAPMGPGTSIEIAVHRSLAVAVRFQAEPNTSGSAVGLVLAHDWTRIAWEAALACLGALQASGRLFVSIRVNRRLGVPGMSAIEFAKWADLGPPDVGMLTLIERELRRGDGQGVLDD